MTRVRASEGFTLIELVVAMTLMFLVFSATLLVFEAIIDDHRRTERHNEAQQITRVAVDRLARDLRNLAAPNEAGFSSVDATKPGSVEKNDRYDFVFKAVDDVVTPPVHNPVGLMRIRYCLDAGQPSAGKLYRQLQPAAAFTETEPSSTACPSADPAWQVTTLVADAVVNREGGVDRPVFRYSNEGTVLPYNAPEAFTDTTRVATTLLVDPTPGAAPVASALTSSVLLRNQNRRPTALFTVTVAGRTVELNASESVDPENERLSFAWYEDGVLRTDWTGVVVRNTYATAGTHTYKLVVTDPAQLDDESDPETVTLP